MKVSIIISIYGGSNSLIKTLFSINNQSTLPTEIIIVDDKKESEFIKKIKTHFNKKFNNKNIGFKYLTHKGDNSLPACRNRGVEKSNGDILLFLDDDVILYENYIEQIKKVYKRKDNVKGVQGVEANREIKNINMYLRNIFHPELRNVPFEILPSFQSFHPDPKSLNDIQNCDTLSGCNMSFSSKVFDYIKFDEKLKKWASGEDKDFSFRVNKKWPNSLYVNPSAKLIHNESYGGLSTKKLEYMRNIYGMYLYFKNINNNLNRYYSKYLIIKTFKKIFKTIIKPSSSNQLEFKSFIESLIYGLKNREKLKKGNLEFFNEWILK